MPDARTVLAVAGYALAALAHIGLLALILASWAQRRQGGILALAVLVTAGWAASAGLYALGKSTASPAMTVLEIGHLPAWLALLFYILKKRLSPGTSLPTPLWVIGLAVIILTLLFPVSVLLAWDWPQTNLPLVLLVYAAIGLVLVEQIYRGARPQDRWAIRYLCLGLGGMLVVDFYFYANGVLFNTLDTDVWAARGYVVALAAPLIAISAARNPEWAAPVGVSRSLAFHTASLIGAGAYLLLMSGAGYYLKLFGGDWGDIVSMVFIFAAGLAGVLAVFSGTLRARFRVFLSKHFFSYRYDYREEWLKFTRMLTSEQTGERLGERVVEALAQLVESPGGALWLAEDSGWKRHSYWNWSGAVGEVAADSAFAVWLVERRWVIDFDEWRARPELYGDLELPAWLAELPDGWLIVPLLQGDELLGFVVLKHSLAKLPYNWEIGDLLKVAARQASAHLGQMLSAEQLIVARQFESFNRTSTFVIHDLKNLVAQLSLLLANAEKHKHNPEFQADMLDTIANAVARMNKVLTQLRRGDEGASLREVSLIDLLLEAAASKRGFRLKPRLDLPASELKVRADPVQLGRAIGHLLQNALEATPESGGQVTLSARAADDQAEIEIRDNGRGMDETFIRTRLFQPFDSTKGAGMGIGVYECRETIRALGGQIAVESTPGVGTRFTIHLPLIPPAGAGT